MLRGLHILLALLTCVALAGCTPSGLAALWPDPGPPPATGLLLEHDRAHVNAPEGWAESEQVVPSLRTAEDPDSTSSVQLAELPGYSNATLTELAGVSLDLLPFAQLPTLRNETQLDGVDVYHLAGAIGNGRYYEEYGAMVGDTIVTLAFNFEDYLVEDKRVERAETVASVVASFGWTAPTPPVDIDDQDPSGALLELFEAQLNAPEGWIQTEGDSTTRSALAPDSSAVLHFAAFEGEPRSLTELTQGALEALIGSGRFAEQPQVELDGLPAYHVSGKVTQGGYYEEFGIAVDGGRLVLILAFGSAYTEAQRDALIASVLASFRWH